MVPTICSVAQTGEAAAQLRLEHLFRLSPIAFGEGFTHADNGIERRGMDRRRFLDMSSLDSFRYWRRSVWPRMTKRMENSRNIPAQISPVNAPNSFAHILRADPAIRTEDDLRHRFQRREWRADDDVHFPDIGQFQFEVANQRHRLGHGFVHLPVAGNNFFTFFVHVLKIVLVLVLEHPLSARSSNNHPCRSAPRRRAVPRLPKIPNSRRHRYS